MTSPDRLIVDPTSRPWEAIRAELTRGVTGQVLLAGPVRCVRTRVEADGGFPPHTDPYDHLFFILAGVARVRIGDTEREVGAGTLVQVPAGTLHGYANAGSGPLELLSFNMPADST